MPVTRIPCPKCKSDQQFIAALTHDRLIGACGHVIPIAKDASAKPNWNNRRKRKSN